LTFGSPSFSEEFLFRVAFANVPGIEEIEAGNIPAGIKLLENRLYNIEQGNSGEILATLCAAYIVNVSLDNAERACNKAVETDPTEIAFNNRGVFRAFKGNLSGAREDFDRARPQQLEVYLSELKAKDVGLLAVDNFRLINKLSATHNLAELDVSVALKSAAIERLSD